MTKVFYTMYRLERGEWWPFATLSEREAMAAWLRAKPGTIRAVADDGRVATWNDYRTGP
jgi:hypothetical protein